MSRSDRGGFLEEGHAGVKPLMVTRMESEREKGYLPQGVSSSSTGRVGRWGVQSLKGGSGSP